MVVSFIVFLDRCVSFCLFFFLSDIVVSVLQFTASYYPFGIFKLFFKAVMVNSIKTTKRFWLGRCTYIRFQWGLCCSIFLFCVQCFVNISFIVSLFFFFAWPWYCLYFIIANYDYFFPIFKLFIIYFNCPFFFLPVRIQKTTYKTNQ